MPTSKVLFGRVKGRDRFKGQVDHSRAVKLAMRLAELREAPPELRPDWRPAETIGEDFYAL